MDHQEIFQCDCHSPEHMIIVSVWNHGPQDTDFCVQLLAHNHQAWYLRIWPAVKYIFGQPSLRWHDFLFAQKDVDRLEQCVKFYKQHNAVMPNV